jgi:hypothetical protein
MKKTKEPKSDKSVSLSDESRNLLLEECKKLSKQRSKLLTKILDIK